MSVNLGPPDPDVLGVLFRDKLKTTFKERNWFREEQDEKKFADLLERLWRASLSAICTNLRKAGLLLNDILAASRPVQNEVNAFDLVGIECLRRFYPDVYRMVRKNPDFLTYEKSSWDKNPYFLLEERRKQDSEIFFKQLESVIVDAREPESARVLLSYLFPEYEIANKKKTIFSTVVQPPNVDTAERERRICHPGYFSIYFRAAVPQDMFSNAELDQVLSDINQAQSESEIETVFGRVLGRLPSQHPKREDFLWKMGRAVSTLQAEEAEQLAYAAAAKAGAYTYDIMNIGEAASALNIIFEVAQKVARTSAAQRVIVGAIARAADDTFAQRLWYYVANKDRNKILIDFSNVDPPAVKEAFMLRMRRRYGPERPIESVNIEQGDWRAFHTWVQNSPEDRDIEQQFWRRYIGQSRKRLAQAINFLYTVNVAWEQDPRPTLNVLFPVEEPRNLLQELTNGEQLDQAEMKGLERFQKLLEGKWYRPGSLDNEPS